MKANTRPKEVEIFDLDKTFIHFITSNFTTRLYIQLKKKVEKKEQDMLPGYRCHLSQF